MAHPSSPPGPPKRSWLPLALVGCGVLILCVLLAGAASAGYWFFRQASTGGGQPAAPDALRAELEALPEGNANAGEEVFLSTGACGACHSLDPGVRIVGPSLGGIASSGATRRPDYPADLYIYESIVNPQAFTVQGFYGGIMPSDYKRQLSVQQLADLLAFLMAQ